MVLLASFYQFGKEGLSSMIQHIVMFKFKESANGKTKAENLREARERMLALKEQIPQIRGMEVRFAAEGSAPANYDYILVSQFDSMEDLSIYQKHPAHVAFGKFVTELREPDGRACMDYQL